MKKFVLSMIIIVLSGCGLVESTLTGVFQEKDNSVKKMNSDWINMTGKWYGKSKSKDNVTHEWLSNKTIDGHYVTEFKVTDESGQVYKQTEKGEWGISGEVYFTIMKSYMIDNVETESDPKDPYYRDAYKILKLSNKVLKYKHIRLGLVYEAEKVDSLFKLQ